MPRTKELLTNQISSDSTPLALAAQLVGERGTIWLDNSGGGDKSARSIIARRPVKELIWDGQVTSVVSGSGRRDIIARNVFDLIEDIVSETDAYVCGYISYEAAMPFVGLKPTRIEAALPLARFYVYGSVLTFHHQDGTITASDPGHDDYRDLRSERPVRDMLNQRSALACRARLTKSDYLERVVSIKKHIREGDIYQANFTSMTEVNSNASPFSVYRRLRQSSPSGYSAYLNFGDCTILSASPERMLTRRGTSLLTSPIKGTIARGTYESEDLQIEKLLNSAKDRAELLMIVDLERNDLGRLARTGSVKVDKLFYPQLYSSVIHLVSDISADLKPGTSVRQIVEALLPGGSVTGAPKKRAMEIIDAHEASPRGIYTGCIGYFHREDIDMNLAIRTMIHQNDTYAVHAGGGIVADSVPELEYEEMRLKMQGMLNALGVPHD